MMTCSRGRTLPGPAAIPMEAPPVPNRTPAAKSPTGSRVEMTTIVMPEDTNRYGSIFGGRVMEWIDKAAAVAALRHCRAAVVTAAVDHLDFLHPISLGDIVRMLASVNYVHRSSMEIGVKVLAEDPRSGKQRHTCSAYLTMVGLDDDGRPAAVPPLAPETADEIRRQGDGGERRRLRLEHRARIESRRRSEA
jgi:acyl-CoA hydrolase